MLWNTYYSEEYGHRVWAYWNQGSDLATAASQAGQDMETILNRVGADYYVSWRIADQVISTRDNGDGTASVRVRPLVFDMLYRSTPYPEDHFLVREGIVTSFPQDHLVWVIGGEQGYQQAVEPPPATCSNPFGGNCEAGCLVGCETACEGDPCQFSCQAGCQTSCEVNCQACANAAHLCGYGLTVDCRDNGDGTVTVSGTVYYDTGTGQRPMAGEDVSLYHSSWGASFVVTTGGDGTYTAIRPRPPAGSTPIYASWTDPSGTDHQSSTSACSGCPPGTRDCSGICQECCSDADCPPGQVCQNGTCVDSGGGGGGAQIESPTWSTSGFCDTGFSVSGRLTEGGAGVSGMVEVYVNSTVRRSRRSTPTGPGPSIPARLISLCTRLIPAAPTRSGCGAWWIALEPLLM
jgi:hypothetical protein